MDVDERTLSGRWSRRRRDWAMAAWVAFLSASLASLVAFALFDPEMLSDSWSLPFEVGRRLGYSLGFAFFFGICFVASGLTVFMIRTGPRRGHARGKGRRKPPETHDPALNNPDLADEDWL